MLEKGLEIWTAVGGSGGILTRNPKYLKLRRAKMDFGRLESYKLITTMQAVGDFSKARDKCC